MESKAKVTRAREPNERIPLKYPKSSALAPILSCVLFIYSSSASDSTRRFFSASSCGEMEYDQQHVSTRAK